MSKKPICKVCKKEFEKFKSTQKVCSHTCAIELVKQKNERELAKHNKTKEKLDRADIRKRKEALKSKSDWIKEVQVVFNQFIRLRDDKLPCISCDDTQLDKFKGGSFDAGHYRSRGASPELRFNEDNCFKQCKKCNRQLSGNVANMRIGILKRIGQARLDIVEGPHDAIKYTIDELKELKARYKQKIKELTDVQ